MPVRFYMDVHVHAAVTEQLRRRGIEVLTCQQDETTRMEDYTLLEHADVLGFVVVTHDIRFCALAESWQREGKPFAGLIFGHPLRVTIGEMVAGLELIATATDLLEWKNRIERLPL